MSMPKGLTVNRRGVLGAGVATAAAFGMGGAAEAAMLTEGVSKADLAAALQAQALQVRQQAALQATFPVLLLAALPVEKPVPLRGLQQVSPPQEPEPLPVPLPVEPPASWTPERPQAAPHGRCVRNRGRRRSFRDSQGPPPAGRRRC